VWKNNVAQTFSVKTANFFGKEIRGIATEWVQIQKKLPQAAVSLCASQGFVSRRIYSQGNT